MIIFRYLTKQLLIVWIAVTIILLLISASGRFAQYLNQAAAGEMNVAVLFAIMFYRIPGFLQVIMPFSLFISIVVVYGRLYADSEMIVLENYGMSPHRLLANTMGAGLIVLICTILLSLWLTPAGMRKTETLINLQNSMTALDMIQAGRFQNIGKNLYYVEKLSNKKQQMNNLFIAQANNNRKNKNRFVIFSSNRGKVEVNQGSRYVVLEDGYRYDLTPGVAGGKVTRFDRYGVYVKTNPVPPVTAEEALSTPELLKMKSPEAVAEIQWRFSSIFLTVIAIFLGLPLSRVNPRQGRFSKLLPGLLLFLINIASLMAAKSAVKHGEIAAFPGLYGINLIFILMAFVLFYWNPLKKTIVVRERKKS